MTLAVCTRGVPGGAYRLVYVENPDNVTNFLRTHGARRRYQNVADGRHSATHHNVQPRLHVTRTF